MDNPNFKSGFVALIGRQGRQGQRRVRVAARGPRCRPPCRPDGKGHAQLHAGPARWQERPGENVYAHNLPAMMAFVQLSFAMSWSSNHIKIVYKWSSENRFFSTKSSLAWK